MELQPEREYSDADLADVITALSRSLRRATRDALRGLGLTPSAARALSVIVRSPEPLRMMDLANRLGIVARSATSLVDVLESAGLVRRETDPENRRAFRLVLTEQGERARSAVSAARRNAATAAFGELDESDRMVIGRELDRATRRLGGVCARRE